MKDMEPGDVQGAERGDEGDGDRVPDSERSSIEQVVPAAGVPEEDEIRSFHARGDLKNAVGAAVVLYGRELFAFVRGMLGAPAADDASMQVWEAVLRGVDRFEWESTFRAWAYTIARRTCYRELKGRGRERRHEPLSGAPEIQALVVKARTETAPYERSEVRAQIAEIRDSLRPEDRMLLILHVDRGMSWVEVAQVMFDDSAPDKLVLARLRKRFQRIKKHILDEARRRGLLGEEG